MYNRRRQGRLARVALARVAMATAIALTGLLTATMPAPARAALAGTARDAAAEQFVKVQGQRLVSILADKSQSKADRIRAFRAAVDEVADVPKITRFVLGKYARTITPAQMQRFAPVFQDYAQNVYRQRLANFNADTVTVTGSLARKPGDVVVATTVSGGDAKPAAVSWRVMGSGAGWKVVDVEVAGVWLAITQQDDFVSTIDNHGGSIDALISRLEELTRGQAAGDAAADH